LNEHLVSLQKGKNKLDETAEASDTTRNKKLKIVESDNVDDTVATMGFEQTETIRKSLSLDNCLDILCELPEVPNTLICRFNS